MTGETCEHLWSPPAATGRYCMLCDAPMTGEKATVIGAPKWNAEARHHWPDGKYVGYTCTRCGVSGFFHHKNGPRLCYPHWQDAQREAEWRMAAWEADMTAEYGPYVPRPNPLDRFRPIKERLP